MGFEKVKGKLLNIRSVKLAGMITPFAPADAVRYNPPG
jgi:hypothetical protein